MSSYPSPPKEFLSVEDVLVRAAELGRVTPFHGEACSEKSRQVQSDLVPLH